MTENYPIFFFTSGNLAVF